MESVLSFGAKKEAKRCGRRGVNRLASFRILVSLAQTYPLCAEMLQQCYPSHRRRAAKSTATAGSQRKDYLTHSESPLEYNILWIRACLIEKKLSEIVQIFITNAQYVALLYSMWLYMHMHWVYIWLRSYKYVASYL